MYHILIILAFMRLIVATSTAGINRRHVVQTFNPVRNVSSDTTPMQVGNGNFAFGADITGMQTFQPFGILSSWGWHNASLPTEPGETAPEDFYGVDMWTHGRLVNYDQPNASEPDISQWMIANPQRINLGRIGLYFGGQEVVEEDLLEKIQTLDLYTGTITSRFKFNGSEVIVKTRADADSDTVAFDITSSLLISGNLGVFFDYPYSDTLKFDAPFVGIWNATHSHETRLSVEKSRAQIQHTLDETSYFTEIQWDREASIVGPLSSTHRYVLTPVSSTTFSFTATYTPSSSHTLVDTLSVARASEAWWENYWEAGAFIDLTETEDARATEIQRRIISSQYLLAVNEAGKDPPQESGLVNNGWYGKFHLEMYLWHSVHWTRWNKQWMLERSINVYNRFLPSSVERARNQGYSGARWGKMSDPTGRSAPGVINSLLIWQQPHPFYFAELEYRNTPTIETLRKWDDILTHTADFMVSFAFWNTTTGVYDLGPPMYPVSENTDFNTTTNPAFELAQWRFGLDVAAKWKTRQGLPVPTNWIEVHDNLAPLPVSNETYPIYERIPNMWIDPTTLQDHPAMAGIYGLLPPTPGFNLTIMKNTAARIWAEWEFDDLYGWDFPMLAMNAARLHNPDKAIAFLTHEYFQFDDVGMPIGGTIVPTPYFPASSSLLLAVAMLASGWDGHPGQHFPEKWVVKTEGFNVTF
ncbi:hypothetical protein B7494_g868 [Chlorociboria aeruginascens]|nr:hypothetical protein B7494_g868 [Chlorociboria aeruginascens]